MRRPHPHPDNTEKQNHETMACFFFVRIRHVDPQKGYEKYYHTKVHEEGNFIDVVVSDKCHQLLV